MDLSYAVLNNADLTGADLTGAKLTGTELEGSKIAGANGLPDRRSSGHLQAGGVGAVRKGPPGTNLGIGSGLLSLAHGAR